MSMDILRAEILRSLSKRPGSIRTLAKRLHRDNSRLADMCRLLEQEGRVQRDGRVYRLIAKENSTVSDDTRTWAWDIDLARTTVEGSCSVQALADTADKSVVGRIPEMIASARLYLSVEDPAWLVRFDRLVKFRCELFQALRCAQVHAVDLFVRLAERIVIDQVDAVQEAMTVTARRRSQALEQWFLWLAHDRQPNPVPTNGYQYAEHPRDPDVDPKAIGLVRRLVEQPAPFEAEEATELVVMLCAIEEQLVRDCLAAVSSDESFTQAAAIEPLEQGQ